MKKFVSKVNGREFWVSVDGGPPVEGLPHFSQQEIMNLSGQKLTESEINAIFDTKLILSGTVYGPDDDVRDNPRQDLGY